MEFKGTKGKWYWVYGPTTEKASLMSENQNEVCNFGDGATYYPTEGLEPNEYDALLISKAPEMLEMLGNQLEFLIYCRDNMKVSIPFFNLKIVAIEQLIKEATTI
jgi:hypothetical protein